MSKTTLAGKTAIITGSSRGIGKAIAVTLAKEGVKVVITGKTTEPNPKLEGTIYSVADEIKQLGGQALPIPLDIRDENAIAAMVEQTYHHFGSIDLLINNASAIYLSNALQTPLKKMDLMFAINVRGTFAVSQACIPFLKKSPHAHILTLSPPLNFQARWFENHLAYTMSKYGMSMCTIGLAAELKSSGVAVNSLWPRTTIATAAIKNLFPTEIYRASRDPRIVAEAAKLILEEDPQQFSGNFIIDEDYLRTKGQTDFSQYAVDSTMELQTDLFL